MTRNAAYGAMLSFSHVAETRQRASESILRPRYGGDKWHLDKVVITIAGRKHYLWRAVVKNGLAIV